MKYDKIEDYFGKEENVGKVIRIEYTLDDGNVRQVKGVVLGNKLYSDSNGKKGYKNGLFIIRVENNRTGIVDLKELTMVTGDIQIHRTRLNAGITKKAKEIAIKNRRNVNKLTISNKKDEDTVNKLDGLTIKLKELPKGSMVKLRKDGNGNYYTYALKVSQNSFIVGSRELLGKEYDSKVGYSEVEILSKSLAINILKSKEPFEIINVNNKSKQLISQFYIELCGSNIRRFGEIDVYFSKVNSLGKESENILKSEQNKSFKINKSYYPITKENNISGRAYKDFIKEENLYNKLEGIYVGSRVVLIDDIERKQGDCILIPKKIINYRGKKGTGFVKLSSEGMDIEEYNPYNKGKVYWGTVYEFKDYKGNDSFVKNNFKEFENWLIKYNKEVKTQSLKTTAENLHYLIMGIEDNEAEEVYNTFNLKKEYSNKKEKEDSNLPIITNIKPMKDEVTMRVAYVSTEDDLKEYTIKGELSLREMIFISIINEFGYEYKDVYKGIQQSILYEQYVEDNDIINVLNKITPSIKDIDDLTSEIGEYIEYLTNYERYYYSVKINILNGNLLKIKK